MIKEYLSFKEVITLLNLQNQKYYVNSNFSSKYKKIFKTIVLQKNKKIYAKQSLTKYDSFYFCNYYEYSKGLI